MRWGWSAVLNVGWRRSKRRPVENMPFERRPERVSQRGPRGVECPEAGACQVHLDRANVAGGGDRGCQGRAKGILELDGGDDCTTL